jgi:hypothetical protein
MSVEPASRLGVRWPPTRRGGPGKNATRGRCYQLRERLRGKSRSTEARPRTPTLPRAACRVPRAACRPPARGGCNLCAPGAFSVDSLDGDPPRARTDSHLLNSLQHASEFRRRRQTHGSIRIQEGEPIPFSGYAGALPAPKARRKSAALPWSPAPRPRSRVSFETVGAIP